MLAGKYRPCYDLILSMHAGPENNVREYVRMPAVPSKINVHCFLNDAKRALRNFNRLEKVEFGSAKACLGYG